MKRLILALCIIITMALTVMAQGVDGIKRNSSYLYGEGGGVTLQAAKEAALADLIQKISVTVHSDFTSKERELNQDGNVTSDAEYQSIIRSYSTATLTNVKTIVLKPEPDASVFSLHRQVGNRPHLRVARGKGERVCRQCRRGPEKRTD